MSLDLSWALLDEAFTSGLLETVDRMLSNASKPDYIGPISITALQVGNEAPEVSIVDIGDIWQGFMEQQQQQQQPRRANNAAKSPDQYRASSSSSTTRVNREYGSRRSSDVRASQSRANAAATSQQDHFAQFAEKNLPFTAAFQRHQEGDQGEGYGASKHRRPAKRLQMYRQYSNSVNAQLVETGSTSSYDPPSSIPPTPASSHWGAGLLPMDRPFSSRTSSAGGYFPAWQGAHPPPSSHHHHHHQQQQQRPQAWRRSSSSVIPNHPSAGAQPSPLYNRDASPAYEEPSSSSSSSTSSIPSLQARLSLRWNTSSVRITINTSLLINHPSPAFMSLPLSITITGLVLQAGGLLAFEVDPVTNARKGHLCLVVEEDEDDDDEGGAQDEEGQGMDGSGPAQDGLISTLGEKKEDRKRGTPLKPLVKHPPTPASATISGEPQALTPGERILPTINLETSVGQVDKHVLRNVAKVERFVVTLVRKAIGDELVFPNFYSIELP